jgi:hypothetical protein
VSRIAEHGKQIVNVRLACAHSSYSLAQLGQTQPPKLGHRRGASEERDVDLRADLAQTVRGA